MIIFLNAMAKGGHDQMIEDAVALNTGHIQIHEKGFWENQTIDYAFQPSHNLLEFLRSSPHIAGYAERIQAGWLLAFEDNNKGVLIQGIDPEQEQNVTDICQKIRPGGRFLSPEDRTHTVIGATLAKNIRTKIGDKISIISQGFDGSIAAERLEIVGIFESGVPEYDREMILIPLVQAAETFTMMGYVHAIVIRLADVSLLETVKARLIELTARNSVVKEPDLQIGMIDVMGWDELMPELVQFIVMDDISAYIFDFILFMVVAFGVSNTIQMSVFERTREFGIMLSIGTLPRQITAMVLMESALISLFGILFGVALGYGASYYFQVHPIDYSSFSDEMAVWGVSTTIFPAKTTYVKIVVTSVLTFGLAILFTIFPARRGAKLNPTEAVRKV
jgi:ABC-type lipoprotein release transport system permease subunit